METADAQQLGEDSVWGHPCVPRCYQCHKPVRFSRSGECRVRLDESWVKHTVLGHYGDISRPSHHYVYAALGTEVRPESYDPIPPTAILSLVQSGYPVDLVFRIAVQAING